MQTEFDVQKTEIALACRVMAHQGLVENVLGHISLRAEDRHLLIRCRGPLEAGLRFTSAEDIRLVEMATGKIVDDPSGEYRPPGELPIHTAVLRSLPDVECVVHAHPPDVVVASLAGLDFVALVGAYDIPAFMLARDGIPVHPRSVLIRTAELADEMLGSLGQSSTVVLKGHGLVSTGASVQQAVLRAIHVDTIARISLGVHHAGSAVRPISDEDAAQLPDLGSGFNETTLWRHYVAALHADGRGLDADRSKEQL